MGIVSSELLQKLFIRKLASLEIMVGILDEVNDEIRANAIIGDIEKLSEEMTSLEITITEIGEYNGVINKVSK